MSIFWFLVWFLLSAILLGATLWSTVILVQQKQAWRAYAKRKDLRFTPNKFFEPGELEGVLDGYNISFFTAMQEKEDARKNRQVTVMQIATNKKFVNGIGAGTFEMRPFLKLLEALSPHEIKSASWNKDHDLRSRNKKSVTAYLTEERVKIISSILTMPNTNVLILMDQNEAVFRFETNNPLTDEKKIDAIVSKLYARIEKLKPSEEELAKLAKLEDEADSLPAPKAKPEPAPQPEEKSEEEQLEEKQEES